MIMEVKDFPLKFLHFYKAQILNIREREKKNTIVVSSFNMSHNNDFYIQGSSFMNIKIK